MLKLPNGVPKIPLKQNLNLDLKSQNIIEAPNKVLQYRCGEYRRASSHNMCFFGVMFVFVTFAICTLLDYTEKRKHNDKNNNICSS
jgi:hypothetical protein